MKFNEEFQTVIKMRVAIKGRGENWVTSLVGTQVQAIPVKILIGWADRRPGRGRRAGRGGGGARTHT